MKKLQCLLTCALAVLLCREVSAQAGTSGKIVFIDQSFKLYVANLGGTPTEVPVSGVYNVMFPHWSPDAQWITFTANPKDNSTGAQVYVVRPDGSGFHRVTDGSGDLSCPSFSPDGSKILFSQVYGNLFTINVDGSSRTDLGVPGGHAEWSPDGTKISYTNWGWTYESDIFIYNCESQTSTKLTHHEPEEAFYTATWAPDGTQLALSKLKSNGDYDVCKINADGTGLVDLSESWPTSEEWPHWSPSGIFFHRNTSGVYDIWLMSPDGNNLQNITNSPTLQELPLFDVIPETAMVMAIDIKPGSYPNAINLISQGLTPVAILSEIGFDARTVNPATVSLSGALVAMRGKDKYMSHEEDVNKDGLVDLVVQVVTCDIDPGKLQQDGDVIYAVLTGSTVDGTAIEGEDEITIVPAEQ